MTLLASAAAVRMAQFRYKAWISCWGSTCICASFVFGGRVVEDGQVSVGGSLTGVGRASVAVDGAGIATIMWEQSNNLSSARSDRATAAWLPPVRIGAVAPGVSRTALTADIAGKLMLLYGDNDMPTAARYSATDVQWQLPVVVGHLAGSIESSAKDPVSVVDASGHVSAVWFAS